MSDMEKIIENITYLVQHNQTDDAILKITAEMFSSQKDFKKFNRLMCLRAECYQMKGELDQALSDISNVDHIYLENKEKKEFNLMHLKVQTQKGDFIGAAETVQRLYDSKIDLPQSALWRGALSYAVDGKIAFSSKFHDCHKEQIESGSFQEANNILYTSMLPAIISGHIVGGSISRVLNPVDIAKNIYLRSTVDFKGRIGNRLKSYCQALLVEAYIFYDFGNIYSAYVDVILVGLLLRELQGNLFAEGIGEIVNLLYIKTILYKILQASLSRNILENKFLMSPNDEEIIKRAFIEALEKKEAIFRNEQENAMENVGMDKMGENIYGYRDNKINEIKGFDKLIKCHPDNKNSIIKLVDGMRRKRVVPFLGAGISAWIYPLWGSLLVELSDEFGISQIIYEKLEKGKFEEAASRIKEEAGEFDFNNKLKEKYNPYLLIDKDIPSYLEEIPKLWKGIVITTNFDHVLDVIYNFKIRYITPHSAYEESELMSALQLNNPLAIKLHGDISDVWNLTLTREQYDESYGRDSTDFDKVVPKVLKQALSSQAVIFLGCSLVNDRPIHMLEECVSKGTEQYALVELPKETVNNDETWKPHIKNEDGSLNEKYNERRKYLSKHRINRIWYPCEKHAEAMEELLMGLRLNV